jgi:hypothetical protein
MIEASNSEPADANGRRTDGKFSAGNSFGRGNPTARHAQRLRQLFVTAVTEEDIKAIVAKLVQLAKAGDIQAANLLLTRALGKPSTSDNSLPIDSEPITSVDQVKTLDDAREYLIQQNPEIEAGFLEQKAQLMLRISGLKAYHE